MAKAGEDMNDQGKTALSKVDFIKLVGIGPQLASFVTEFIESPEIFFSMSLEKRCEIENQMDAVLSSLERRQPIHARNFNRSDPNSCRKGH